MVAVKLSGHEGARMKVLRCGSGNKRHEGRVGVVVDGCPADARPAYVVVDLSRGNQPEHCLATLVDEPEAEGED